MYSVGYSSQYEHITLDEIQRGILYADIALVIFALGTVYSRNNLISSMQRGLLAPFRPISIPITQLVAYGSIAIGSAAFFLVRGGTLNLGGSALANYIGASTMWPMTGMLILYYLTKNFWVIAVPATLYLSVVSLQGYHRFMLVLPVLSLISLYLLKEKKNWPPFHILLLLIPLLAVFPALKSIGQAVSDRDYAYARQQLVQSFNPQDTHLEETSGFLDQMAGFLTLCDRYPTYEFGKTYLRILVLPIPRAWWDEKPGMADHLLDRSTASRPYGKEGRITTHIGQAYVNFGMAGVIIMPFVFGYLLGWLYERTRLLPYYSLGTLIYIFLSASFIQAYRDGFNSVILFGLVFNMPLFFLWFAHLGIPKKPFPSKAYSGP